MASARRFEVFEFFHLYQNGRRYYPGKVVEESNPTIANALAQCPQVRELLGPPPLPTLEELADSGYKYPKYTLECLRAERDGTPPPPHPENTPGETGPADTGAEKNASNQSGGTLGEDEPPKSDGEGEPAPPADEPKEAGPEPEAGTPDPAPDPDAPADDPPPLAPLFLEGDKPAPKKKTRGKSKASKPSKKSTPSG